MNLMQAHNAGPCGCNFCGQDRAMANESFDRNRKLFEEARKLKAELRAERKRICSA